MAEGIAMLYARILELENECDQWQKKLANVWAEVASLRLIADLLDPEQDIYLNSDQVKMEVLLKRAMEKRL